MRKLLNEISVIPGVSGSCIFDKKEGPVCQELLPGVSEDSLHTIGTHLLRLLQMGAMTDLSIQSIHFRYDKYAVVGMPLDAGLVLLTICEAHANCSLVATTAGMLVADMREDLSRGSMEAEPDFVQPESIIVDEQVIGELQRIYSEIEETLAAAIGPIAGMVFQDDLDKWKASGPEIPTRLTELVAMIAAEIADPNLAQEFRLKLEDLIEH